MEYRQLINSPDANVRITWSNSFCNELGRLAQGYKNRVKYTDAIEFIHFNEKPTNKKATYARVVAEVRPQKKEEISEILSGS